MTTTMQQGFLDDIIAHPEDDTPRLIYADWLQDHGEEERAEFIRCTGDPWSSFVGCYPRLLDEVRRLTGMKFGGFGRHSDDAARPYLRFEYLDGSGRIVENIYLDFARGFVHTVRCPLAAWLQHGPEIAAQHPLETVRLVGREPDSEVDGDLRREVFWWFPQAGRNDITPSHLPEEWFVGAPLQNFDSCEAAHAWASERAILWARGKLLSKEQA